MSIEFLFLSQNFPFTAAMFLVLALGFMEVIGLALGAGLSDVIGSIFPSVDVDVDVGSGGMEMADQSTLGAVWSWLRVGQVPIVILFVILLTAFAFVGFLMQLILNGTFGFLLPSWIAIVPAFMGALPVTRWMAGLLHKYMPKDENYAVSNSSFIGREAEIVLGEAKKDFPAQAKVQDEHGKTHYLMIQPDMDEDVFKQNEKLLIVRQEDTNFFAIRA